MLLANGALGSTGKDEGTPEEMTVVRGILVVRRTEFDGLSTGKLVGVPSVLVFVVSDDVTLGKGVLVHLMIPELLRLQLVVTNATLVSETMLVAVLGTSLRVM